MDWISCLGYGNQVGQVGGNLVVRPLMTIPDFNDIDPSAYQGGNDALVPRRLKVHRVVGQIYSTGLQNEMATIPFTWGWRLMALPWDFAAGALDTPWADDSNVMTSAIITDIERWWGERWLGQFSTGEDYPLGLDTIDVPWWTHVDLKPGATIGMDVNLWPCLVVDTTFIDSEEIFRFVQRLRMLVSR